MSVSPDSIILANSRVGVQHAVRELCKTNFLVFQKVELGFEIGNQHRIWAEHLQSGSDVIELAPRDHGKSHSICRAYSIWKIKYNHWVKEILILGADQPSAVENLDKIKELIANSPSLSHLLPKDRGEGQNSRTEVRLKNGKFIKAKGYMSPLRGRHPQLIILDDVLNERNSWDTDSRNDVKKYFYEVVLPMKDKGLESTRALGYKSQIVVVGTAQDYDDLYHDLLKNGIFEGEKLTAIISHEEKTVLWPERYTYEDLMLLKRTVGTLSFSKEYMNDPMSDETTIFPTSILSKGFDSNLSYVKNYQGSNPVYMGVDFSVPGSTDGDWTVIIVLEYDKQSNLFRILNYWRARPDLINEQLRQIEYYCQMYRVTLGLLEDNMFQGIYREHFKKRTSLPLQGHTVTGQGKRSLDTGVLSLRPMFENEQIVFPYKTEADRAKTDLIVSEFNGVRQKKGKIGNETTHDDIVMSIWHAVCASRKSKFQADFGS